MKKGKQAYYNKYFETNWNNIKNTCRAVKSLIYLKTAVSRAPTVLSLDNSQTTTNPYDIANTWLHLQKEQYSYKHFPGYIKNECSSTIFFKTIKIKKK